MNPDNQNSYRAKSAVARFSSVGSIALHCPLKPIVSATFVIVGALLAPVTLLAQDTAGLDPTLPALQNTPEGDRVMLLEIGDQFIFDTHQRKTTKSQSPRALVEESLPRDADTVWEFVQQSRRLKIPDHERISHYRQQYREEAMWVSRILRRATPFAGHVVEQLDRRYLPVELALLPVIESGYRPDVHSSQDAAGIWQIVPRTAEDIGLAKTLWFDGRSDIRQSTTAAIDYLSYLNAEFHGDWLLTLAAYNAGLGRVRKAIRRNSQEGQAIDFWSLKLPSETRNYVPKFLALVALLRHDRPKDLELPEISRGSAFDLIDVRQRVSLDRLAILTGLPEDRLQKLNAGLVYGITPPEGPHLIYVPQGFGKPLIDTIIRQGSQRLYTPTDSYIVAAGDNLGTLARRHNISIKRLMEINALDSPTIRIGQKLTVFDASKDDSNVKYVVTIGDTLSDIAQQFQIKVTDIRDEQGAPLVSDIIHPGETLSLLSGLARASGN
ncbi:MAG: transglycosylase SLT domain-containing protein [Granulosicoccus sp.]